MTESRPTPRPSAEERVPRVCVLVPVTPGAYPLDALYREYSEPLRRAGIDYEFVFVLADAAPARVDPLRALQPQEPIRMLRSGAALPEAALSQIARTHTSAPVLVTLPSYPRVVPDALLHAVRALDEGYDLVNTARANRADPIMNRIQRRTFHFLLGRMVGGPFRDIASGVRAMSREVLLELDLYGDFFRFVPMFAVRDGFRVLEIPAEPHPDDHKTRVYSPGVYVRRLIDLVGLMLLVRFVYKPLRFFGLVGSALTGVGSIVLAVLFVQRVGGRGIADRPMLLLGVLLVVLGLQVLALGLVGEIVVHHNVGRRPTYRVSRDDTPDESDGVGARGASGAAR